MLPAGPLALDKAYVEDAGAFSVVRLFVPSAEVPVVIKHGLGRVPYRAQVVSAEGKWARCCLLLDANGIPLADNISATLVFDEGALMLTVEFR